MTIYHLVVFIIFFISALLLFHTYWGLYLSLKLFIRKKNPTNVEVPDELLPTVTVIIPAYNEEELIEKTVNSLLAQDYPPEKLTVAVGSDLSTDRTDEIVRGMNNSRVRLIRLPERGGKCGVMDYTTAQLTSDVVITCDANMECKPDTIRRIAERFSDPKVGCVGSRVVLLPPEGGVNVELESSYRNYETRLKMLMSRIGKVVSVYGGLFGYRRTAYTQLVNGHRVGHDDCILPPSIIRQGFRSEFADNALAYEETNPSIKAEFKRRVRMTSFSLNSIAPILHHTFRTGCLAIYLAVSYKVLRWLAPFLWGALIVSVFLLGCDSAMFGGLRLIIILGILLALLGWVLDMAGKRLPLATACYHFAAMNIASYIGLRKWISGGKGWWTPRA